MTLFTNVSCVYDEIVAELNSSYNDLHSTPSTFAATKISGYVHTLPIGNAILITDDLVPYLITNDMIAAYNLQMGDRIQAKVAFSPRYERPMVIAIDQVHHVDYQEDQFVKTARSFRVGTKVVGLGRTALCQISDNADSGPQIDTIFTAVPLGTQKIVLSFDGRAENYRPEYQLYRTKPAYPNRDKLTVCLQAFFHAKELAAQGRDVVLVIDSLDKMFNVFNNCMQKFGTIDPNFIASAAVTDLESILCSSGCLRDKGTFTIVGLHRPATTPVQQYITERFYQLFDTVI